MGFNLVVLMGLCVLMGSFWWGSVLLGITRSFWWGFDCLVPLIAILVETQRFVLLIAVLPGTSPTVLMGTAQTRIHLKAVLLGNAFNCSDGNNWFLCHSAGSVLMGILRFRWRSDGAFREHLRVQCILPSISRFYLRRTLYRVMRSEQNLHGIWIATECIGNNRWHVSVFLL